MVQASSAASYLATVGINTSITMIGSAYQNYAQMMNALAYVGVTQVRDTYDNPFTTAEFARMADQLPLKFDFFIALGSASPEWQLEQIRSNPGIVSYVEGYNESDTWWQTFHGATGPAATRVAQAFIDNAVKTDPALSGVGVIQASFGSPVGFAAYGNNAQYADYASTHTYFGTGNNPSGSIDYIIAQAQAVSPGLPTIATEAGYHTTLGNVHGVSELVQAKYELDLLFEQAKAGVKLTYLWELADNYADPGHTNSEDHFGIFNNDWTPKLAALALHNTMAIMADPGTGGVAPGSLDFSLGPLPSSVQTSLFEKSDGTFVLVVWNDVRLSGPVVQGDIAVAPIATTLQLGQPFAHAAIFDPLLGTAAQQQFSNTASLQINVVDHPIIIELSQDPAFAVGTDPIAAPSQILTNPLQAVGVYGLSVAAAPTDMVTVQIRSGASGLSILDANGRFLANRTDQIQLAGAAAAVNAELATLTYTGGALGSDSITISATVGGAMAVRRTVPVRVEAGTTATYSGGPAVSMPKTISVVANTATAMPRMVVSDTYAATHSGDVSMSLSAGSGTLQVTAAGATISGNQSSSLCVTGSFGQIAAALASLGYTASPGAQQDSITCTVTDQQGFSSVGRMVVSVVAAPLTPLDVIPIVTQTITPVVVNAVTPQVSAPAITPAPAITAPVLTPSTPVGTPAAIGSSADTNVFRFFDSRTGAQFLTSSTAERDAVIATRPDLVAEGDGLRAMASPGDDPDAIAIYRFFDTGSGTHFYTSAVAERDSTVAGRADLIYEGISFYEHQNAAAGDAAVYRFFDSSNGTHFYTSNASERGTILSSRPDLVAEGIAFYAPQA